VNEFVVRVPRRILMAVGVVVLAIILLAGLLSSGTLARATATTVADLSDLRVQQAAAERDLERSYEQATTQVQKVRALKLAISASLADEIATKAFSDLRTLRHSAFVSLAQALGTTAGNPEAYATVVERRFDDRPVSAEQSAAPVLLAPRLYAIVSRMTQLSGQLSDKASKDLTEPPAPASSSSAPVVSSVTPGATARP
jgi:hypothetical protein